ncbi:MAG: hypothetical protein DHS20C14_03610 [Phycisphaeraceae bacterium]|nr:MAG: hypothetical protein DHS20C14_03610 [Phycisphaeraceae bacterium]
MVIAIVALLISLLLPALSQTRITARRAVCLSQIHSTAQATFGYARDADGRVPGLSRITDSEGHPPGSLLAKLELPPSMGGSTAFVSYFEQSYLTNVVLELSGAGPPEALTCPNHPQGQMLFSGKPPIAYSTYTLPESFAADPAVFDPAQTGPADVQLARVQRVHDVLHPSSKVLLFERRLFHERGQWSFDEAVARDVPVPTALSDGHGAMVRYPTPPATAPNRLRGTEVVQPMATIMGVLGSDSWTVER